MAFQPATNVMRIVVNQEVNGISVANILHALAPNSVDTGDCAFLANAVLAAWKTSFLVFQSSALTLTSVQAYDLTTIDGASATVTDETADAGSVPSPSMPGNVALCITLRSGSRGRTGRGRLYIAGIPENQVVGNLVDESYRAGLESAGTSLSQSINATLNTHVILSRRLNNVLRPLGIPVVVTSVQARNRRVDSQRRRLGPD